MGALSAWQKWYATMCRDRRLRLSSGMGEMELELFVRGTSKANKNRWISALLIHQVCPRYDLFFDLMDE